MSAFSELADNAALHPDVGRALRGTVGFMVPFGLAAVGWVPLDVSLVAIAAQNLAMVDLRGDYRLRIALLAAMSLVFAGTAALGATVADAPAVAVLATGLMAVLGGLWRHLSSDYGPPLAISSTLVFLLALSDSGAASGVGSLTVAALTGSLWGLVVQVAHWPFRPQHALRTAAADSWLAVAALFDALVPDPAVPPETARERFLDAEATLRTTLDQTYATLAAARADALRTRLEAVNLAAARLSTRVVALQTALESALPPETVAALAPALEPVLVSLSNVARSAALLVVSRQPAHLAAFEVRQRRLAALLAVLHARAAARPELAQLAEILRQVESHLGEIHAALRATLARTDERTAVSLELLDLRTQALRPLASALNLSLAFDPALVRFTLRLAALTMLGIWIARQTGLPHGYWLPFTVVVVLQPDYGSTRQRAGQRVVGTLAGSLLASALLWLELPHLALLLAAGGLLFGFGYFLKRAYSVAVVFITLFIVVLTEAQHPVTLAFTLERLALTLAGGLVALGAAFVFWPVWERDRLPPILAAALRADRDYLLALLDRYAAGQPYDDAAIGLKRRAETANTAAFSSLRRLTADPRLRREGLEHAAALMTGSRRLTRALNVLTLHLGGSAAPSQPAAAAALAAFRTAAAAALDRLADGLERHAPPAPGELDALLAQLERHPFSADSADGRARWAARQFGLAATEIGALLVAWQNAAPAWSEPPAAATPTGD